MSDELEKTNEAAAELEKESQKAADAPVGEEPSPSPQPADAGGDTGGDRAPASNNSVPASDPAAPVDPNSTDDAAARADNLFGGKGTEPVPETPKKRDPSDDITSQIGNHIQTSQTESDAQEADKMFGGESQTTPPPGGGDPTAPGAVPPPGAPPEKPAKADNKGLPAKIMMDMLHGGSQLPSEVTGGVLDALHSGLALAKEIDTFVTKHMPNLPGLAGMVQTAVHAEAKATEGEQLDKVFEEPDSVTGKMVRGMAEFMTGFLATGEAGKAVGVAGKLPGWAEGVAKAAVTDFSFFEGKTENLANLIEKFPKLSNPITQIFQTHPDDPELLNRVKNSVTGMGTGLAADAMIEGFVKTVNWMRKAGGSSSYAQIAAKWLGHDVDTAPTSVHPFEVASLGDSEAPLVSKKVQDAADATAGITPAEVLGQGPAAHSFNFSKINTVDDVRQAMGMVASREKARIDAGGTGPQTVAQTNAKAGQLDAFDVLLSRREGGALSAPEMQAARQMHAASGEKLTQLAQIAAQSPTQANLYMFERMSQIHSLINKEVMNATSEAGRALNILRQPVGASGDMAKQISQMLENMGGAGGSLDKANKVLKLASSQAGQAGVDKFVQGTFGKSVKDAVDQAFINGRFGQKTLVVKTVSDFANMGMQMVIRRNAEYLSQKLGTQGGVAAGEAMAQAHGWVSANAMFLRHLGDNLKDAASGVMSGETSLKEGAKELLSAPRNSLEKVPGIPFELPPTGKISADNFNIPNDSYLGKALNVFGPAFASTARTMGTKTLNGYNAYTQVWGRGISLVDQYSKMVGYHMELHARALRQATAEMPDATSRDVGAFHDRIADIVANPPADIHLAAVDQATYQTFTGKPAKWLDDAGKLAQSIPIVGRMIVPFKSTPINIMTQALEGSPLAPMLTSWRADLMAGGARADIAMSKMATGTALFQLSLDAAMKGLITGKGPEHNDERANWERLGNQPYSIKAGDGTQVAYNRFEPESYHLGVAADIADAIKRGDATIDNKTFMKVMAGAVFSIANNVGSKTYLEGAIETVRALFGTEAEHEKWIKKQIGTIPATIGGSPVTTLQQYSDPLARTTDGMIDALFKKIPGLSKTLPLQRNIWGETLDRSSELGAGYDAISPYWLKTAHPQPIDQELDRLKYFPDMPQHTIRDGGKVVEMDGHQYDRFMELAGNGLKDPTRGNLGLRDFLNQMVQEKGTFGTIYRDSGKLDAMDGGDRQKQMIKSAMKSYQDRARAKLVVDDGGLQANIDAAHAGDKMHSVPVKQRVFSIGSELKGD